MLDPLPLPPDLAVDEPPLPEHVLAQALRVVEAAQGEGLGAADAMADAEAPEQARRWTIESDGAAEWAMRHVAEAQDELDALTAQAQDWVERIGQWFVQARKPVEARLAFFEHHLQDYALRQRAATGDKRKTVTLPSGAVTTRASHAKAVVHDEAVVLAWARNLHPEVIKVTEKVLLTELREVVAVVPTSGEVVLSCGCIIMPPTPQTRAEVEAWSLGAGVTCPSCAADALVGQVRHTVWLPYDPDTGQGAEGVAVEQPNLTASVKPGRP